MDAGLSALRLILRGTFDRHPDLQLVLGHWGEMLLFWMDRVDSLSGVAEHLERRVSDYINTNIHITSSGMLQERLLRHTLYFTSADRVLFSTDYPFHRPDATAIGQLAAAAPVSRRACPGPGAVTPAREPARGWQRRPFFTRCRQPPEDRLPPATRWPASHPVTPGQAGNDPP